MPLAPFRSSIEPAIASRIVASLDEIARAEGVRILFAVESGSRAWGFPSPDSDYDVRFVYARPVDWYLSLEPGRDVIERPIENLLDIGGWDVKKALSLLLKPNPVLLEWLSSPIRYRWDEAVCAELLAFAATTAPPTACRRHYASLAERQKRLHLGDPERVVYKKYFYVLRPALALLWLRDRPETALPMNLQAMAEGLALDPEALDAIAGLIVAKATLAETGAGPRLAAVDRLIDAAFAFAADAPPEASAPPHREAADALFRRILGRPAA